MDNSFCFVLIISKQICKFRIFVFFSKNNSNKIIKTTNYSFYINKIMCFALSSKMKLKSSIYAIYRVLLLIIYSYFLTT